MNETLTASITIRNLDETVKRKLRLRAAQRNRSMEDGARHILRTALAQEPAHAGNLADAIRRRVEPFGGFELSLPPRGAALATRNVDDFVGCKLELIDPWL